MVSKYLVLPAGVSFVIKLSSSGDVTFNMGVGGLTGSWSAPSDTGPPALFNASPSSKVSETKLT